MKSLIMISMLTFFISCMAQNTEFTTRIDLTTLQQEVINKDVQFVDVRTSKEYKAGHIDDAIHIDISNLSTFKTAVNKLDKTKPIYIYCHMGGRSNKASKILEDIGFTKIYDFSGGWKAWSKKEKSKI